MENFLKQYERIDDLQCKGLKIIQSENDYCFTMDAVLLANYAKVKKDEVVCDLCTGSGILPLLMSAKTKAKKFIGIDINIDACDRARRSVEMNNLESRIDIINDNVKNTLQYITQSSVDVVTVNPPYLERSVGEPKSNINLARAYQEIDIKLEEIIEMVCKILKYGGKLYMVQSTNRLVDTLSFLRKYEIEPKKIDFIKTNQLGDSKVFLLEASKKGKKGVKVSINDSDFLFTRSDK